MLRVTGTVVPILYFLAMSGWSNTLITSCSTLFCVNHSPTALQGLQFGFSNFIMLMPQIYKRVFVFANIIFTFVVFTEGLQLFLNKIWIFNKHLVYLYNKSKQIVMETIELTTKRGLTYGLRIESYSNSKTKTRFEVLAVCAEDSKVFFIDVPNHGIEFNQENDDISEIFSAMDLTPVERWVDSVVSSEVARLATEVCVNNTTDENYWSYSIYTLNTVRVSVIVFGDGTKTVVADYSAAGYDDIIDMLIKLRK